MMLHLSSVGTKYSSVRLWLTRCSTFCTILMAVITVLAVLMFFVTFAMRSNGPIQIIYVESNKPSSLRTEKNFLSIGLDSIVIAEGFKNFNMTDEKLIKMIRYLAPGYIRIGGNLADKLYFNPDDKVTDTHIQHFYNKIYLSHEFNYLLAPNYTMSGSQWLKLAQLAEDVQMDIFFDLNALIRFKDGSWDYRNAETLIKFSEVHKIKVNWELGNEPNSFKHKFNELVNASQLAEDFRTLRNILNKYPMYKNSLLIGPDVTRPLSNNKESQIYLKKFLKHGGHVVNAITWHQYYLNGCTAQLKDFLNPETFDCLKKQITKVIKIVNTSHIQNKPIWLGETSSAYGGGAPKLSDTFIGSFLWIDKLGLAAKMGVQVVMRQSIFRGYYALLDDNYDPNPDWWVSMIYKHLVGRNVVPFYTASSPKARFYVHCTKSRSFYDDDMSSSITIFGINLDKNVAKIRFEGLFSRGFEELLAYTFELTGDKSLMSKGIRLNGKILKMLPDNTLPVVLPKIIKINPFVTMPPLSIVFWVIPNLQIRACL